MPTQVWQKEVPPCRQAHARTREHPGAEAGYVGKAILQKGE